MRAMILDVPLQLKEHPLHQTRCAPNWQRASNIQRTTIPQAIRRLDFAFVAPDFRKIQEITHAGYPIDDHRSRRSRTFFAYGAGMVEPERKVQAAPQVQSGTAGL